MRLAANRWMTACFAVLTALAVPASAADVTVFAAASLKNALEDVARSFEDATGAEVRLSFAGSSALARQIQAGAPADVFISAHPGWMDALEADGLTAAGSRFDLLTNRLVLIAHGAAADSVEITQDFDLEAVLGSGRLAMALADAVPAGIYAKAALQWLGQWDGLAAKSAQAGNVRIALALVARGDAPYGIVYASDATAEERVSVAGVFPQESHPAIVYPAAALNNHDATAVFLSFLKSGIARAAFEAQGFAVLPEVQ